MTYDEFKAASPRDMRSRIRHADGTEALLVGLIPPGTYASASSMSAVKHQEHYSVMVDVGPGPRPTWDLADCEEVM
jgi:hypothetical protein